MASPSPPIGELLRDWRQRRRLSQLDLALEAEISTRHLSFVETGRARPSRGMVLHLAERLEVPLRERNRLLVAAGFAPAFRERPLDDPAMAAARHAVERVLAAHGPFPALAVDRHWTLVAANATVQALLGGVDPALLAPPVNVLRLSLHPRGLAPAIVNLGEWRSHILVRLRRQAEAAADPVLARLLQELSTLPTPDEPAAAPGEHEPGGVIVPLRLRTPLGLLELIGTTTVFGTALDITLAELTLETFFPADVATAAMLHRLAGEAPAG